MEQIIYWLFLLLYIFIAYRFAVNGAKALVKYYKDERRSYQIISGNIVEFEERSMYHHGHRSPFYYPIFEYVWKEKTRRGRGRRVMARFGPGFSVVPATKLQVGDAVWVRVFPSKPSASRLEEAHYFWKSRIWVQIPSVILGCVMMAFGIYWGICSLIPGS